MHYVRNLFIQSEICGYSVAYHPDYRLSGCTVSVFLCLDIADAGGAVSALHNPVLDIKCDQDDFMDTAIGA